jgi:hypothetical protein
MCNTFCFPASPQFPLVPLSSFSIVLHVSIWDRCVLVMAPVLSILAYSHRYIGNHGVPEVPAFLVCANLECKKAGYFGQIPPFGLLLTCHALRRFDVWSRHWIHFMEGNGHEGNMSNHRPKQR